MRELRLALVGAPGCGKGTHASKLASGYGLTPLSTGNLLRDAIANKTLDEESTRIMTTGGLVPSKVVVNILVPTLQRLAQEHTGWVLDGFPRKLEQAEHLHTLLAEMKQPLDLVLFIDVDPAVIMSRIAERRVHPASGRVYNLSFSPPKVPGVDDLTGEPLIQRDDDKPETVKARLAEYALQTQPILDFYKNNGLLVNIKSPTSPEGWVRIQELLQTRYGLTASKL